jgi:hypothetical protein
MAVKDRCKPAKKIPGTSSAMQVGPGKRQAPSKKAIRAAARQLARAWHLYPSEYWVIEAAACRSVAPDQICQCAACLKANPGKIETPDAIYLGGRLFPRTARAMRIHAECREIELAPPEIKVRPKRMAKDPGWCGEPGCWRRIVLRTDDAVATRDVRIREGFDRRVIGWEEYGEAFAQFREEARPDLLTSLNDMEREDGWDGLDEEQAARRGDREKVGAVIIGR